MIQPFDSGKFDKRFEDVYQPAIEAAGLDAYRVDRDPKVEILIDAIEKGIRAAAVCLADITADNPNVWYELGYAFASGQSVVMVCSDERNGKYPFDIQHRTVIQYVADAPRDFDKLRNDLTEKIKALLKKGAALERIAEAQQISPVEGLSQPELVVLASLAASLGVPHGNLSLWSVRNDAEKAGLTTIGFSLGLRRLINKGYIKIGEFYDGSINNDPYDGASITEKGWSWIDVNESKFVIHRRPKQAPVPQPLNSNNEFDDDIPF